MTRIVLVRHAMPAVEHGISSVLWGITESAREDCVLLAHHLALPPGGFIFASAERKASETADVLALRLGREVAIDDGFGEVDRPTTWDEDYRALVVRYLSGENHPGWEPRERVIARFGAAVERANVRTDGDDVVIVNHGQALALYLAARTGVDLVPFWQQLTFPDAWQFDTDTGHVSRLYETGLPPPDA